MSTKKVVLIACCSKKLSHPAKAKDLYVSPLFKLSLKLARKLEPEKIFILSAKDGLVDLEQIIEPYDLTLNNLGPEDRKRWAGKVRVQLSKKTDFDNDEIVFLAGENYRRYLLPLFQKSAVPLKGLGIGKQLQYLKRQTNHG